MGLHSHAHHAGHHHDRGLAANSNHDRAFAIGIALNCVFVMLEIGAGILAGIATIAPWLIRNWAACGNPVFPFASRLFGTGHWIKGKINAVFPAQGPVSQYTVEDASTPGARGAVTQLAPASVRSWLDDSVQPAQPAIPTRAASSLSATSCR